MIESQPLITPLILLLKSRKFIVSVCALALNLVVAAVPELAAFRSELMTVITGLALPQAGIEKLARTLKQQCGSGGTVRDGVIEIQGEHRDAVVAMLAKLGIEARRSGG